MIFLICLLDADDLLEFWGYSAQAIDQSTRSKSHVFCRFALVSERSQSNSEMCDDVSPFIYITQKLTVSEFITWSDGYLTMQLKNASIQRRYGVSHLSLSPVWRCLDDELKAPNKILSSSVFYHPILVHSLDSEMSCSSYKAASALILHNAGNSCNLFPPMTSSKTLGAAFVIDSTE